MRIASRLCVPIVFLGLFVSLMHSPSSGQTPPAASVSGGMYELLRTVRERGDAQAQIAGVFVDWMATHDWQSMEVHDHYNLYSLINVDSLNRRHFSARWTGSVTAPVAGAYTLRQTQVYRGTNSQLHVVLNGQTVLDSTQEPSDASVFTSAPVELTAGEAVPVEVELVHDGPYINFSEGAPMIVLTWQRTGAEETIIPTTAFTPPTGFGETGAHGLKGEYFATTGFQDLKLTRLDPALDLVWSWPPVASVHDELSREVFAACIAKVLDGEFLAECVTNDKLYVLEHNLWRIAFRMTATERQQLVETLRQRPEVLAAMKPVAMGKLMQAIYLLPSDDQIDLLGEWAGARPQPRCKAGRYPGWGNGYYRQENTDYYWLMGQFLQGPYADDAATMCERYLVRPNGDCNLPIAYAAAYSARANGTGDEFLAELTARIDDPSVQGDRIVTWLFARAFAAEVMGSRIEPLAGYPDLESAYISAESDTYKLWALEEMVARLSSVDQGQRAKDLIEENRNRFAAPDEQAALTAWAAQADSLEAAYVAERASQAAAAADAYRAELGRRQQQATDRGDTAAAARFGELLDTVGATE